jgi:hypothetical protein
MRISDIPGHNTVIVSVLQEDTRQLCHWRTIAPAGLTVAPHHHHRDEVLTVRSGRVRFVLDKKPVELVAGQQVLVPAYTTHSHVVIRAATIDYHGEAHAGLFVRDMKSDGTEVETELYISRIVWSRPDEDAAHRADTDRRRLYRLAGDSLSHNGSPKRARPKTSADWERAKAN